MPVGAIDRSLLFECLSLYMNECLLCRVRRAVASGERRGEGEGEGRGRGEGTNDILYIYTPH